MISVVIGANGLFRAFLAAIKATDLSRVLNTTCQNFGSDQITSDQFSNPALATRPWSSRRFSVQLLELRYRVRQQPLFTVKTHHTVWKLYCKNTDVLIICAIITILTVPVMVGWPLFEKP